MLQLWGCAKRKPIGLKWRASSWSITAVVALSVAVDLLVYSCIIPIMPFHLEKLRHHDAAALTGWLLFAYSGGLVLSTIPIAMLSERYNTRKIPLIIGLVLLTGSQVLLMEAPNYAVMCVARVLQGISSSMVWVVGLALLCDSASPTMVGLQLGIAMCGLSVGLAVGPPVGGILYSRYGYRGPFVFSIAATIIDLVGRLIIIERKDAVPWGYDPAALPITKDKEDSASVAGSGNPSLSSQIDVTDASQTLRNTGISSEPSLKTEVHISLLAVMCKLFKSRRALVALFIIFAYGVVYSCQEPAIPVHLQRVWHLTSLSVGLVFIAAVVPTLFSSPLTGYYTDKRGAEWATILSLLFALPWWVLITIEHRLSFFIVVFGIQSFFTSGVISPLTAELAAVSRESEGVGYAHVYGAFNLVYGIGTTVGPIIGGQLFDNFRRGWLALCLLATGLLTVCLILAFCFVGSDPILRRLLRKSQPTPSLELDP